MLSSNVVGYLISSLIGNSFAWIHYSEKYGRIESIHCLYTHAHTYRHIHTDIHTHTDTHTHIYIYRHTHTHTHTDTHIYTYTYRHTHTHIHIQTYTYTRINTHTDTHTHSHTDTHTDILHVINKFHLLRPCRLLDDSLTDGFEVLAHRLTSDPAPDHPSPSDLSSGDDPTLHLQRALLISSGGVAVTTEHVVATEAIDGVVYAAVASGATCLDVVYYTPRVSFKNICNRLEPRGLVLTLKGRDTCLA